MTTPLTETTVAVAIVFPTAFIGLLASGVGLAWAQLITVILCSVVGSFIGLSFDDTMGGSFKRVLIYVVRGAALSVILTFTAAWALEKYLSVPSMYSMLTVPLAMSAFQHKLWALAGKKIDSQGDKS